MPGAPERGRASGSCPRVPAPRSSTRRSWVTSSSSTAKSILKPRPAGSSPRSTTATECSGPAWKSAWKFRRRGPRPPMSQRSRARPASVGQLKARRGKAMRRELTQPVAPNRDETVGIENGMRRAVSENQTSLWRGIAPSRRLLSHRRGLRGPPAPALLRQQVCGPEHDAATLRCVHPHQLRRADLVLRPESPRVQPLLLHELARRGVGHAPGQLGPDSELGSRGCRAWYDGGGGAVYS